MPLFERLNMQPALEWVRFFEELPECSEAGFIEEFNHRAAPTLRERSRPPP